MATIKKPVKKYAMGGMTTSSETTKKPKVTPKDDVNLFSPEDTKKRRKLLNLPKSKAEEKAYYEKMRKEGAKNGKTIKKAQSGLGMKSVKSGFDKNSGVTRADFVAIGKGTAKSGTKIKKAQYGGAAASMVPPMKKGGKLKKAGMHKMPDGSMMKNSAMKSGGSMKKCKYGCK